MQIRRYSNVAQSPVERSESNRRLKGWKAIGQFLACTERTAMRWASDRGMPVHRAPGGSRSVVWAYTAELSGWLASLHNDLAASGTAIAPPDQDAVKILVKPSERGRRWFAGMCAAGLILLAACFFVWRPSPTHLRAEGSLSTAYDDDPLAREAYLTAKFDFDARTASSLIAAEKGFRQLTERYPDRAAAWSGLADTNILLREFGPTPDDDAFGRAAAAARTALSLDPNLADAWLEQGFIAWWWHADAKVAFPAFERALNLDPASARAWLWYANALECHGDFSKALQAIARARLLDPGNRAIVTDEAMIRFDSGERTQGLATLERMAASDPTFASPHYFLSLDYAAMGRDEDFLRQAIMVADLRMQPDVAAQLRLAQQRLREGGRQEMLRQLGDDATARWKGGNGTAVSIARYRALAQDRDGMLRWLRVAEERHDSKLMALRCDPIFAPYRDDPEVRAILARL